MCGREEVFVGVLNENKEKSKTNTKYNSMVSAYRSAGKCFRATVL